jgi:hypothetical protein
VTRAPLSLPGRTVIFDYGEVISLVPSAADRGGVIAGLAGFGCGSEPFWRAYFDHRDGLDQGTAGTAAYWQAIAGDVGASWDDARVHELWAAAVFIDNRAENVRGAQALGITGHLFTGITGHLFTGAAALRAFLTSLPRSASTR